MTLASQNADLNRPTLPPGCARGSEFGVIERPLVSVIVPSFNQGRFLRATLESILGQSYRPLEVLVMDGGSTDESVDVLKSFGDHPELKWVSERDAGVVDAVNKGFAKATGDIVGIQSSDDCYLPGALEQVVAVFQQKPDTALVYGDTVKIDADGNELLRYRIGPWSLENFFLLKTWIPQPSAFFRRECLAALGGWDATIPYAPDTDLWMRIAFRWPVVKLDEYLSQRRIHGEQRDTQAAKIARDYARMIAQSPDLARATPDLQRKARAGMHLLRVRYNGTGSDWSAAWNLVRAGLIYPACLDVPRIWQHLAVLPIRRTGSRLKRLLKGSA